ncbi:MAG: HD domain-containing protein [Paracoccaceae bacterium]|nr:HD domain-containing protein [Paracoccaceae bacterium]MDE3239165.1 HD domain-containing protein [Paracoccaceae bacterium]
MTASPGPERLARQFAFLQEADRLKGILRATPVLEGARPENSGEHSWHLTLYALVLADQAGPEVRIDRVIRMLILHDLVEIDAGDTPIHIAHDPAEQAAREQAAADRLFGLLPDDLGADLRAIWEEFEAAESPDAIFAKSIDRVQPVLQNIASGGGSWVDYNVTFDQLESRVGAKVARGAPGLWPFVRDKAKAFFDAF